MAKFNRDELLKTYSVEVVNALEIAAKSLYVNGHLANAIALSKLGPSNGIVCPSLIVTTLPKGSDKYMWYEAYDAFTHGLSVMDRDCLSSFGVLHDADFAKQQVTKGGVPLWV